MFVQISGSAWALPNNNIPSGKHVGCPKLSNDASQNFGLFTPLDTESAKDAATLELRNVEGTGMNNQDIGLGVFVFTKVSFLGFLLFGFFSG
jgi:hypothetical protein